MNRWLPPYVHDPSIRVRVAYADGSGYEVTASENLVQSGTTVQSFAAEVRCAIETTAPYKGTGARLEVEIFSPEGMLDQFAVFADADQTLPKLLEELKEGIQRHYEVCNG